MPGVKVICGLGNPGAEYAHTRHNAGWWAVEHAQRAWRCSQFRRVGRARLSEGSVGGSAVLLVEPLTYMNRSGDVLAALQREIGYDAADDLLVIVDDSALPVDRLRVRASGSAGGHNGLKSVEASLGTRDYARLRIGVGAPPPEVDMVEWVLAEPDREDERAIVELLPLVAEAAALWIAEGAAAAANRVNG